MTYPIRSAFKTDESEMASEPVVETDTSKSLLEQEPNGTLPLAAAHSILTSLPIGVVAYASDGTELFRNPAATSSAREPTGLSSSLDVNESYVQIGNDSIRVEIQNATGSQVSTKPESTHEIYQDDLTGLANRRLIRKMTEQIITSAPRVDQFAFAFIDIDNFKQINDSYGHAAGDLLLLKLSDRIRELVRSSDLVARVAGDEFAILINPITSDADTFAFVERIATRLQAPFFIDGREILASASIGISIFPQHGRSYDSLNRAADSAMYAAKASKPGSVKLFDQSLIAAAEQRYEVQNKLRTALRDRLLCPVFQPKFSIRSGNVVGVEALLRYRDEQSGVHAFGEFSNIATELGVINEITEVIVAETISRIRVIDSMFGDEVSVSINIAARQATDIQFMASLTDVLEKSGFANRIILEITEDAFISTSSFQFSVLPLLKSAGLRVSIDDFGVGYSSLSALADITADEIKVDCSLISGIHNRPRSQLVLRTIESLAASLGLSVVAEGVETLDELLYLKTKTDIDVAQGFYLSKPFLLEPQRSATTHSQLRATELGRSIRSDRCRTSRTTSPSRY